MPELNNDVSGSAVPDTAADTVWPELAASGSGPDSEVADPVVRTILDQVREVPGLPVSEHPAAYAGMHDALLGALNEEPLNEEPQNGEPQNGEPQNEEPQREVPQHDGPRPGPGAA